MSAQQPVLELDCLREQLRGLGLLHAAEALDEEIAEAVRKERPGTNGSSGSWRPRHANAMSAACARACACPTCPAG